MMASFFYSNLAYQIFHGHGETLIERVKLRLLAQVIRNILKEVKEGARQVCIHRKFLYTARVSARLYTSSYTPYITRCTVKVMYETSTETVGEVHITRLHT